MGWDDWSFDSDAGPSTIDLGGSLDSYDTGGLGAWGNVATDVAGGYDTSGLGDWSVPSLDGGSYEGGYPTLDNPTPDKYAGESAFGTTSIGKSDGPLSASPYSEGDAPKAGITSLVKALGSKDNSILGQLKNLYSNKEGDLDLTKIVKLATGLGGLYGAANANKAGTPTAQQTPQQLQAQLVQNNTKWTPQQAQWADKFFTTPANRSTVQAGANGIQSILPSRSYAEGGSIYDSQAFKDLIEERGGAEDGVVPLINLINKLGVSQGNSPVRVHGSGGVGMAEGGDVPVDMQEPAGPLSHGDYGLVSGEGDGQSDMVQINASPGEYVFDAETVSMLGNGSNEAGADILDQWREFLREHKRGAAPDEIGPASKDPNDYLPQIPDTSEEGVE